MQLESRKYLFDIERAARQLTAFLEGKEQSDYLADPLLRAGVERQFEIVGEAMNRLAKIDLETAQRIPEFRRVIAFRNVLIHGYADIDDLLVWDLARFKLPGLLATVEQIIGASD